MPASRRFLSIFLAFLILFPAAVCYADTASEWYARGEELFKAGDYKQAVAAFDEAISLDPDHADAYRNRGLCYHSLRILPRAVADFSEVIRLRPAHPSGYALRGKTLQDMGKYQEALDDFSKALELDPAFVLVYNDRGVLYMRLKQYDKALADFTRAIDLHDIDLWMALTNRGHCYMALGQPDKALDDLANAIALNPQYMLAYYLRGGVYIDTGRPIPAIADFTAAIELNPRNPLCYLYRGKAYLQSGKPDLAVADGNKTLQLAPSIYPAYWLLYEAYSRLGQKDDALRALARYMNYAPLNDPDRARAKKLLAEVQVKEVDPQVAYDKNPPLIQGAVAADGSPVSGQERQVIRTGAQLMAAYNVKDLTRIREFDIRARKIPDSQLAAAYRDTRDWALRAVEVLAYKDGVITARLVVSYEILGSGRPGQTFNHLALICRFAYVDGLWRAIQVTDELSKDLFDTLKLAEAAAKRFGTADLAKLKL